MKKDLLMQVRSELVSIGHTSGSHIIKDRTES